MDLDDVRMLKVCREPCLMNEEFIEFDTEFGSWLDETDFSLSPCVVAAIDFFDSAFPNRGEASVVLLLRT